MVLRFSVSLNNSIKVLASSVGQSMYFTLTGIGIIYFTIFYVSHVSLAEPQWLELAQKLRARRRPNYTYFQSGLLTTAYKTETGQTLGAHLTDLSCSCLQNNRA